MDKIKLLFMIVCFLQVVYPQQKYGSELLLNIAVPAGSQAKYYNTGLGVTGGFYYDIENNIRLGLSLGYIRIGANSEEIRNYYKSLVSEGDLSMTGSIRALPVNITFRLISPDGKLRFYGLLEGGLFTYWIKASGNYINNGGNVTIDKSEFRSEPGFALGVGTLFKLEETLSLDFNVKFQFVQDSEYINIGNSTISTSRLLIIGAGLNWNFDVE
jgi:opacity protein-like surface antigen